MVLWKKWHFRWISEVSRIGTGRDEGKDMLGRGESRCNVSGVWQFLGQKNPSVARVEAKGGWAAHGHKMGKSWWRSMHIMLMRPDFWE